MRPVGGKPLFWGAEVTPLKRHHPGRYLVSRNPDAPAARSIENPASRAAAALAFLEAL